MSQPQYLPAGQFYYQAGLEQQLQTVYKNNPQALQNVPSGAYITGIAPDNQHVIYTMQPQPNTVQPQQPPPPPPQPATQQVAPGQHPYSDTPMATGFWLTPEKNRAYQQVERQIPSNAQNVQITEQPIVGPLAPGQIQRPINVVATYEVPVVEEAVIPDAGLMEPAKPTDFSASEPMPSAAPHPQRFYTEEEGKAAVAKGMGDLKTAGLVAGAVITAPALGVGGTLIAAGSSTLISQGIKAYKGEGALTSQEVLETAAGGVIFGATGKAVMAGLGASEVTKGIVEGVGQGGVKAATGAAGRVGVNTALGAGSNYVMSGGDIEAAKEGAVYGFAFGAAGEIAGPVASKVSGKVQEQFAKSPMAENLTDKMYVLQPDGTRYQPSLPERLAMRATGLAPPKPSLQVEMLPTVETVPKSGWVNEWGIKNVGDGPDRIATERTTIREAEPIDSINNMVKGNPAKMGAGIDADTWAKTANTVAYGKSVEPAQPKTSTQRAPVKPDLPEYYALGDDKGYFGKMPEKRTFPTDYERGITSKNAAPTDPLSFNKTPNNLGSASELGFRKANMPTFDPTTKEYMPPLKNVTPEKATWTVPERSIDSFDPAKSPWAKPSKEGTVTKKATYSDAVADLTRGNAASPTGAEKVLSDLQSGRAVDTGRVAAPKTIPVSKVVIIGGSSTKQQEQQTATVANTVGFGVPTLKQLKPPQQRVVEEETIIYASYPKSGLPNPQTNDSPTTGIITRNQPVNVRLPSVPVTVWEPNVSESPVKTVMGKPDKTNQIPTSAPISQETLLEQPSTTNIYRNPISAVQRPKPTVPKPPMEKETLIPNTVETPIQSSTVIGGIVQKMPRKTPVATTTAEIIVNPPARTEVIAPTVPFSRGKAVSRLEYPGGKFEGASVMSFSPPRLSGKRSRQREYPVLDAADLFK